MLKSLLLAGALFGAVLATPLLSKGAESPPVRTDQDNRVHARPWAFGQSESRKDAIWQKGVSGKTVSGRKNPRQEKKGASANTEGGIDSALSEAEKENVKGSLGMSLDDQSTSWKVSPEQKKFHPDESMFRDRKHVARVFADVKAGDDLNISVGPELILKDEQHGEEAASENQPDSALGLGMKFEYGF